jgi:hypothetical protein
MFVAGAYRCQLALLISNHLNTHRPPQCCVCRGADTPSCAKYKTWPQQVAFKPMGESDKPWGAKEYFTIGRELVMLSKPAAELIMDLGRRVQAHLQT